MNTPSGFRHPATELDAAPNSPAMNQVQQAVQQMESRQATLEATSEAQAETARRRQLAFDLLNAHVQPIKEAGGRNAAQELLARIQSSGTNGDLADSALSMIGMS